MPDPEPPALREWPIERVEQWIRNGWVTSGDAIFAFRAARLLLLERERRIKELEAAQYDSTQLREASAQMAAMKQRVEELEAVATRVALADQKTLLELQIVELLRAAGYLKPDEAAMVEGRRAPGWIAQSLSAGPQQIIWAQESGSARKDAEE